jgi:hypothetical protein
MATWQFVADMASASPTVNLDMNNGTPLWVGGPIRVADGYTLDPPRFGKGYAGSRLRHGSTPTNSVAENRILTIPLVLLSTGSGVAAVIEDIGQQVMADNILKVQFGSSNPVFFRTYADPDYAIEVKKTLVENSRITLTLEAEPFAYGVRATAGTFTVSNNPAAGTNPCRFDVSVEGDAPTPLLIIATSTGASGAPSGLVNKWVHIGARRRGSSSAYSPLIQAENMTQGTGGVVTADAAMSGGSKSRIGFATATNTLRLSDTFPENGTAVSDARGEYIVYARCAKTVAGDVITVQLGYGSSSGTAIFNDTKTLPAGAAGPYWVELGKVPVPSAGEPKYAGFAGGSPLKVLLGFVGLWAARTSGSGSLDVDCLYFMPADDQTLMVKFPSTDTTYAVDGTTPEGGAVYSVNTALDTVNTIATPPQIVGGGGFPEAIPLQQNRFHFLRHIDPNGTVDAITDTTTLTVYYWPRWREFTRP